ncbi:MAG: mevalonate kinase family protein [Wenzhouxiangella sp.]
MRQLLAAAPGKAVLIGEYAVLHGTPALVMAVDRRVRVHIRAGAAESCSLAVPQLLTEPLAFQIGAEGRIDWLDRRSEQAELALSRRLLETQLRQSAAAGLRRTGGLEIRIDSAELFGRDQNAALKLGLGSSAAVSVALSAALKAFLDPADRPIGLTDLLDAHRNSQGGRGSGVDLAASLLGGVLAFRLEGRVPQVRALAWPRAWPLRFVWTGEAAATGGFLARYAAWQIERPGQWSALNAEMDRCARLAVSALDAESLDAFMTCINNYCVLMGKIGDCTGLPVMSSRHRALAEIAQALGAAYKPCGAGGGDLGMFVASDARQLAEIDRHLGAGGFRALALQPSLTGLQLTLTDNTTAGP